MIGDDQKSSCLSTLHMPKWAELESVDFSRFCASNEITLFHWCKDGKDSSIALTIALFSLFSSLISSGHKPGCASSTPQMEKFKDMDITLRPLNH